MDHLDKYCWEDVGVRGDRTCDRLDEVIHCRFCEVFRRNSTAQFTGEALEDYLISMYERMNEESGDSNPSTAFVVFNVEERLLAVPVESVGGIVKQRKIFPVPGRSNDTFLGLVNIGGNLELCFSLHAIMKTPSQTEPTVLLNLHNQDRSWVFPVSEVVGIYRFNPESIVPNTESRLSMGTATHNQRSLICLDPEKLVRIAQESLS